MKKSLILTAFLVAGVSGYWMGRLHQPDTPSQAFETKPAADSIETKRHPIKNQQSRLEKRLTAIDLSTHRKEDLLKQVNSNNPLDQIEAFLILSKNLDAESIRTMTEAYENGLLGGDLTSYMTLHLLTYAWAQKDPHAALKWATERDPFIDQGVALKSILNSWANDDPKAAHAWAKENFGIDGNGNRLLVGVIQGMSEKDLVGATELMAELENSFDLRNAASILVAKAWEQGDASLMEWTESLPEGKARDAAYSAVGKKLSKEDMDRAMTWVNSMDESEIKVEVAQDIASSLAQINPEKAANWVASMPEGETFSKSMENVVNEWAEQDPVATGEWLNKFPDGKMIDASLAIFSHKIAKKNPDVALEWANSIQEPKRRERVIGYVNSMIEKVAKETK